MIREDLGPWLDELCAVLHGKGCTVREVAITYVPLLPEEAPDPGASCRRVGAASTLPPPRGDARCHDSAGTLYTSRLVFPSWRERPQEKRAFEGGDPQRARTATKDVIERRAERVTRRRDGRRAAALSGLGEAARAIARFQ